MLWAEAEAIGAAIAAFPVHEHQVRAALAHVSLPEDLENADLSAFGFWPVPFTAAPATTLPLHRVALGMPTWDGDQLVRTFAEEPIPIADAGAVVIAAIDAERDRRQQLDFSHDFGAVDAIDDFGAEIEAGVRILQMRSADQLNWGFLQSQALAAVVAGGAATLMPMRAEDNWNVQTTASQVLAVTAAMFARNAILLFYGGQLKSQARVAIAAGDHAVLAAVPIETGWPE